MNGHDELIDLLGAYALDAVDEDERRAVEDHLELCAECRAEVARHLEVAAALGTTAAAAAPDELWASIALHIGDGPVEVPESPLLPRLAAPAPDAAGPVPLPSPGAAVVSLDARRRRSTGFVAGLVAAAAVIAVLAVGLVQVNNQNRELTAQLAQVPATPSIDQLAAAALEDSSNRVLELTGDDGEVATAVVTPGGEGYLVSAGLEPLPGDRTYQLWNIGDAGAVSLGVLGSDPGVSAFHVQGPVSTLAITAERAGGVPSPENIPLATSSA